MNFLRIILFPFAVVYGMITWLRNKLFDWGVLPSKSFDLPVIGVGNLSTGGTGKTPHIEYLLGFLQQKYKVAALSRGYKRKSRGYQRVTGGSEVASVGDEPLQIYTKFPDAHIAVCESRKKGIKRIIEENKDIDVILLDDAFQHRYVKPGLSILLTDYHKIFTRNYVLPTGNLREFRNGVRRTDALIVSKTPSVFSPLDRRLILRELKKYDIKNIFFSYIKYGEWVPFTEFAKREKLQKAKTIFMITGIANPTPLGEHLKRYCADLKAFKFADHHQFTEKELIKVTSKFQETYSGTKAILTTEKDSMRLKNPKLAKIIEKLPVYYVPIEVDFHANDKEMFNKFIMEYMQSGEILKTGNNKNILRKPVISH